MANRELDIPWEQVKLAAVAGVPFVALARQYGLKDKQGKPSTGAIRVRAMREKWPVPSRLLHKAKQAAKRANEELEKARKAQPTPYLSQANSPNVLQDTDRRDTEREDMEPGLEETGFSGEFPINQGTREHESRKHGMESGSMEAGSMEAGLMGGNEGMNASSPLQTSETLAATLISSHMAQLANESIMQALTRAHASIHAAPQSLPIATIADLRSAMKLAQEATGLDKTTNNTQLNILVHPTPKQGSWNFSNESQLPAIDLE